MENIEYIQAIYALLVEEWQKWLNGRTRINDSMTRINDSIRTGAN